MQVWRLVLEADRKYDLTLEAKAMDWFQLVGGKLILESTGKKAGLPSVAGLPHTVFAMLFNKPSVDEFVVWAECVQAARSVSKRLKKFVGRTGAIATHRADAIMVEHVSKLKPEIVSDGPISEGTFIVTYTHDPGDNVEVVRGFGALASLFWQDVFGSMIFDTLTGHCAECGVSLGFSKKTKKPRRGDFCKKCLDKIRWKELPIEERRTLNREKLRRWRTKRKAQSTSTIPASDGE